MEKGLDYQDQKICDQMSQYAVIRDDNNIPSYKLKDQKCSEELRKIINNFIK